MKQITNLTSRPVVLEDGTILAAARTDGSVKSVESVSESDARRLGDSIFVSDVDASDRDGAKKSADETSALPATSDAKEKK